MAHESDGVYLPTSTANIYESTPLANAGWYDEGQHGGAFSALIVGHLDSISSLAPMQTSRVTVEIFRVIPLVPLRIEPDVVREGKRIQTIAVRVFGPDDTLLSIAMVQRLRSANLPLPDDAQPPSVDFDVPDLEKGPEGEAWGVGEPSKVMFHRQAMEVQSAVGGFGVKGPGASWLRLKVPLIAGRANTPLQRVVAAADFVNGISRNLDFDEWVFMNPDLSIHISRYPNGEWVGVSAESNYGHGGRGIATGRLWDEDGMLGRSTQTLYLDRSG